MYPLRSLNVPPCTPVWEPLIKSDYRITISKLIKSDKISDLTNKPIQFICKFIPFNFTFNKDRKIIV